MFEVNIGSTGISKVECERSNRKSRISIISGTSLAWNPRVLKEALALTKAGFSVTVIGASASVEALARDQGIATAGGFIFCSVAVGGSSLLNAARAYWTRLRFRAGRELRRYGYCGIWQAGLHAPELYQATVRIPSDYVILHNEQALLLSQRLFSKGMRLGVDLEDWHSEDLPLSARSGRPVNLLRTAEREILMKARHVTCTSRAMSRALCAEYQVDRAPTVIYNTFPWSDRKTIDCASRDRGACARPSILWFSQTIGSERGLEDLFACLPYLDERVDIHLRGNPTKGFENWLTKQVPAGLMKRVKLHQLVPFEQLLSRISEHDIGFAGEMPHSLNRQLTITNKILQYLLGGLAVVASDTAGQREVASVAGEAVILYRSGDAKGLAKIINELVEAPAHLSKAKAAALDAAQRHFSWEHDEKRLVSLVTEALVPPC